MKGGSHAGSVYTCFEDVYFMPGPLLAYFIVSGEHPTLPAAELEAVFQALRVKYRLVEGGFKLVEVEAEATPGLIRRVAGRAGYTDEGGVELFRSEGSLTRISGAVKDATLNHQISAAETFSVRVDRFGEAASEISRVKLEAHLGWMISEITGAKVNLGTPEKMFRGIFTNGSFLLGLTSYQRPRASIANRRPGRRPAFHPSTMVPKLARCMVNLTGTVEGSVFLDPFCGVGGILLEACLVGCEAVGLDAVPRMVRGARQNLTHFGVHPLGLLRGDARHCPVRRVDAIATDPPYGTGASTLKSTTREILQRFLPEARGLLSSGRRLVLASPLGTGTSQLAEQNGFAVLDRHEVYVHRSLTREILVLRAA